MQISFDPDDYKDLNGCLRARKFAALRLRRRGNIVKLWTVGNQERRKAVPCSGETAYHSIYLLDYIKGEER